MQSRKKRPYILWGSVLLLLIAIRLLLPSIVLYYANKTLAGISGYYGHVSDIDIDLYRGAYQLDSIYINKRDSSSGKQTPFFSARTVDLSVEWRSLFKGRLVGELKFDAPILKFTKDRTEIGQVAKDTNDFRKILKSFMPLKVNKFLVNKGSIHYIDYSRSPAIDIALKNAYVLATNLKNTTDRKDKLPSDVTARATAYGGTFRLHMKLDPMAKHTTFDLNANLKDANLVQLNDFFKAYGKFDVSGGRMGMYTEFAAAQGKFKGYVKPIIKDLKVKGIEDRKDKVLQKAKETAMDAAAFVFKNQKKDQLATKVPIEGTFQHTSVNSWEAVWEVLKNAFIEALMPSVDNEIDLSSAENVEPKKKENIFEKVISVFKKDEDEPKNDESKSIGLRKYQSGSLKKSNQE